MSFFLGFLSLIVVILVFGIGIWVGLIGGAFVVGNAIASGRLKHRGRKYWVLPCGVPTSRYPKRCRDGAFNLGAANVTPFKRPGGDNAA